MDVALIISNEKTASKWHMEHKAVLVTPQLHTQQGIPSIALPGGQRRKAGVQFCQQC